MFRICAVTLTELSSWLPSACKSSADSFSVSNKRFLDEHPSLSSIGCASILEVTVCTVNDSIVAGNKVPISLCQEEGVIHPPSEATISSRSAVFFPCESFNLNGISISLLDINVGKISNSIFLRLPEPPPLPLPPEPFFFLPYPTRGKSDLPSVAASLLAVASNFGSLFFTILFSI